MRDGRESSPANTMFGIAEYALIRDSRGERPGEFAGRLPDEVRARLGRLTSSDLGAVRWPPWDTPAERSAVFRFR